MADKDRVLIPDGIHFGLDKDDYHNDPALGSTNVRALMVHPAVYWWSSQFNPLHQRTTTKWLDWGTAFDTLITDGPEAFGAMYYRGPSKADYPKDRLMVTVNDLKAWLRLKGMSPTGEKPILMKRILDTDPEALIWDAIVEKHETLAGARYTLPPDDYDAIRLSSAMITKAPSCQKAFQDGYPQVSVFWTDRYGTRCKCRFDYLKQRAYVELKSFRNRRQMPLMRAIYNAIGERRYDVQMAWYRRGRAMMREFIESGKVWGGAPHRPPESWLDRFATIDIKDVGGVWIFYQAEGAPIARRIDYEPAAIYHDNAETEITFALESYRRYREVFGEQIWVDVSDPHRLTTEDLPAYLGIGT